ncbi:hypothetical protein GGR58DRAFT_220936 [Xylaria digitata]|nr:hypothetical protein GGR58DRAFT_220936 [Xylaria digitata]
MNSLALNKIEPLNQIPATSAVGAAFPRPPQSKANIPNNSANTDSIQPFSRTPSKTFPRSNKEREKDTMASDSRAGRCNTEGENTEEALRRRRQPVPDDFKDLDKSSKNEYGKFAFNMQIRALEAAVRREQGGKQQQQQHTQDSKRFVELWESKLLARLEQVLDDNIEGEYTVNVSRGPEQGKRTIVIMTAVLLPGGVERQLRESKSGILPNDLDSTTAILFQQGKVQFLADPGTSPSRPSSRVSDDSCIDPLNTDWSPDAAIGDSVGWDEGSATLGPLLQINKGFYRLVCWHLFDDRQSRGHNYRWKDSQPPRGLLTYRPSPSDSRLNGDGNSGTYIGDVVAYSGAMYKTSRLSVSIPQEQAVTDWALIDSTEAKERIPQPNIVRRHNGSSTNTHDTQITQDADPAYFLKTCEERNLSPHVYSVGRTSGYTTGQLGLALGRHRLASGQKTKNWTVENMQPGEEGAIKQWTRGGMGVPGDSGAGVFGFWNNELLGQIWGRNTYVKKDAQPRLTFFTSLVDIYADIKDKMPGVSTVRLPTPSSITDCAPRNHDLVTTDVTWGSEHHAALSIIKESLDDADFDEETDEQDSRHRSAATSQRLGAVMAIGKKAGFFEPPRHRWARVIIHAATF